MVSCYVCVKLLRVREDKPRVEHSHQRQPLPRRSSTHPHTPCRWCPLVVMLMSTKNKLTSQKEHHLCSEQGGKFIGTIGWRLTKTEDLPPISSKGPPYFCNVTKWHRWPCWRSYEKILPHLNDKESLGFTAPLYCSHFFWGLFGAWVSACRWWTLNAFARRVSKSKCQTAPRGIKILPPLQFTMSVGRKSILWQLWNWWLLRLDLLSITLSAAN